MLHAFNGILFKCMDMISVEDNREGIDFTGSSSAPDYFIVMPARVNLQTNF
jgi:hypothetical protein